MEIIKEYFDIEKKINKLEAERWNQYYLEIEQHFLFSPSFLLQDKKDQIKVLQERVSKIEESL